MGNTCTSQMYQVDKKVPKRQTVQLVTENQIAEHNSDFNFEILEPSVVASTNGHVLAEAANNPERLVKKTNVRACFKHPSSDKNIRDFSMKKQTLSTQPSDR